jgi:Family of unknown function (DUF6624)
MHRTKSIPFAVAAAVLVVATSVASAQIDESLQTELLKMLDTDQAGRAKILAAGHEYGFDSPEVDALSKTQGKVDERNVRRLKELIAAHGWPGESLVGPEGARAAFLILQHADHATQVEYLPLVKNAVESGDLGGQALALLQDRILIAEGRKQIYGTQLRRNKTTGALELYPIEDEANVDARRAELDMQPLAEYVRKVRGEGDGN